MSGIHPQKKEGGVFYYYHIFNSIDTIISIVQNHAIVNQMCVCLCVCVTF